MQYCKTCFYPHTKPDLILNELGICSACTAYSLRSEIDWKEREEIFKTLCETTVLNRGESNFDCIIPVSGGKDSHYQVLKALEYKLKPLLVCAVTDDLSPIGDHNLKNIAKLAPLERVYTDKLIRRKINKYTLETIGDISWAEHVTIFTIPFQKAVEYNIPLIIWGENPQNEYGGPTTAQQENELSTKWLAEFGGLNGLRVSDIEDVLNIKLPEYKYPITKNNINLTTPQSLFLGSYFPWDGYENAIEAQKHGFVWSILPVEGSGFLYENLDNFQTGIHDYFKYLKFGFSRATDICNNHLRRGRISRETAQNHILLWDGMYPATYLGKELNAILNDIGMSNKEWYECINKFANKKLFRLGAHNTPIPIFKEELENA